MNENYIDWFERGDSIYVRQKDEVFVFQRRKDRIYVNRAVIENLKGRQII